MSPGRERSCRDYESLLVKKYTGELLLEENQSLKSHLAQCASCAAEERKLARVWQRLDSFPVPEIPTALYEKTRQTIVSELKRKKFHFPWIEKIPRTGIWLFLLPSWSRVSRDRGLIRPGAKYGRFPHSPSPCPHPPIQSVVDAFCRMFFLDF